MLDQIIPQILLYISDFSKFAQKLIANVDTPDIGFDWLIVLFVVFAILVVALSFSRSRMLLALLSLYIAAFLEPHFMYFDKLKQAIEGKPDYWLHIFLFVLIYVCVFALLNRSILKGRFGLSEFSVVSSFFMALAEAGFLAALLVSYLPEEFIQKIPSQLLPYLATKNALFWWALSPLIILILSKKKKGRSANL